MKNKNFKISIIVVSLNTKNLFLKTIQSILNQTYKNKEIIVIDGNSNDGTVTEIKKLKKYFSNIIIEKDKGIYHAMNKGINLVSGNWVMFINSGDVLYNKDTLKKIFKQNVLDSDILYGDTVIHNGKFLYLKKSKNFSYRTHIMPFCHQSSLVKADIIKKKKFSLKYKYASDFDFFTNCFTENKIFNKLNFIIAMVVSSGVSDLNRIKVYEENISIIKKKYKNNLSIASLIMLKYLDYSKRIIKFILPKFIVNLILRIKYYKNIK